jgi:hypothetical protein
MFTFSPNDNPVSDRHGAGSLKDRNFGANRKVTDNVQKTEDYTKPTQERRSNLAGNVEEELIDPDTTMDIDDLNDSQARKRESSRRAETSTTGAENKFRRPGDADDKIFSDSDHRTKPDTRSDDDRVDPNPVAKHGSRNPYRFGEDHDKPADQNVGPMQKPR